MAAGGRTSLGLWRWTTPGFATAAQQPTAMRPQGFSCCRRSISCLMRSPRHPCCLPRCQLPRPAAATGASERSAAPTGAAHSNHTSSCRCQAAPPQRAPSAPRPAAAGAAGGWRLPAPPSTWAAALPPPPPLPQWVAGRSASAGWLRCSALHVSKPQHVVVTVGPARKDKSSLMWHTKPPSSRTAHQTHHRGPWQPGRAGHRRQRGGPAPGTPPHGRAACATGHEGTQIVYSGGDGSSLSRLVVSTQARAAEA